MLTERNGSEGDGQIKPNTLRVHYYRRDGRYAGWGLHFWGDATTEVDWDSPLQPTGFDSFGTFWDVSLCKSATLVKFIIHKGDEQDRGEMVTDLSKASTGRSTIAHVWVVCGEGQVHLQPPDLGKVPLGDLTRAAAHWLDSGTLAWRLPACDPQTGAPHKFLLHSSASAGISAENQYISGADEVIALVPREGDLPDRVRSFAPHLHGCTLLCLPPMDKRRLLGLLRSQLVVSCHTAEGAALEATGVQLPGVLDELFFYDGPLGARVLEESVEVSVWAPTAQRVELLLWPSASGGDPQVLPMECDPESGAWLAEGPREWEWSFYNFRVTVYCPWTQQVEVSVTTDPYSRSLAADGARSQIVDLEHEGLRPPGWREEEPPPLSEGRFADMAIYELHVRDFSAADATVPEALRGKYLAFCEASSRGSAHLRRLSEAGVTHLHLLPTYDFGSVPERASDQEPQPPEEELRSLPPDSSEQQARLSAIADADAYNWGYDPVHWGVPEGSYATDPDGPTRVLEFRRMVQAIHATGLRVVLDVVYNHTFASGPDSKYSVLDKIVPGYYHRRGEGGHLLHSTCCNNTATEHLMCERLVVDDCVHWATAYKVDGLRFDIMGHLLARTMQRIRDALRALTPEADGVDGSGIYIYGEAWDFGEMSCNRRGRNACQLNIGGLGIGSFNDRFRDSVMGGSPFLDPRLQGVATGLATDIRMDVDQGGCLDQLERLLEYSDWLRLSLAGAVRGFTMVDRFGKRVRGLQVLYGAVPAAYTQEPWECVNYAACHDNETLFDQVVMKSPAHLSLGQRLRMYNLALSFVALGQAVPFFHAGDDILRSKSLDRDSYNSGDWFNRLDWSMSENSFGAGLPPADKNQALWHIHGPLLADERLRPTSEHIAHTHNMFVELLAIRRSTRLLHLPNAFTVKNQVRFHNTGPAQMPGVIVMEVVSGDLIESVSCSEEEFQEGTNLLACPSFRRVFLVFNCRPNSYDVAWPEDAEELTLHPIQAKSCDKELHAVSLVTKEKRLLRVPARTAAVFVEHRNIR
uniref:Alpha--glucosidase n=1 Tax=Tetraselmis sp. GSL018 TaxID=582737 RepID=A0A061RDX2_9CHLO